MNEATVKGARILIVDDDISATCLQSNFLHRIGYSQVECINDSILVFEEIEKFQPDLLLLDLRMPNIDGFQVLEQLKKIHLKRRPFPILVLSASATAENKRKALAVGATDLLAKPADPSEVVMRIRNLLQAHFLRIEIEEQNRLLEQRVSERTQELERALVKLTAAQNQMLKQERLHAFAEMAGGVVHDFSNALMSMIGYSEILLQNSTVLDDRPTVLKYLRTINTAGRDAAHVISRLRDFYRPRESGDPFEAVDLNEVIEDVVPLTQPKWKAQALEEGRTISVRMTLEKIPPVNGNASELREALTNLVFNAVDAMPEGGLITLYTRREASNVVLEIRDTGTGMNPEVRNRCLEPFFSTKGDKGTGLGLSMVFGIIKRHDGELEIESDSGKGTTFRIRLPSLVPTLVEGASEEKACERVLDILVIDDEEDSRTVVTKFLASDGHRVTAATSGDEALKVFGKGRFDVVLTDHGMPRMSGIEFAQASKQSRPHQPVILLTGFNGSSLTSRNLPPEVNLVLNKPITRSALRHALVTVLNENQQPRANHTAVLEW